MTWIKMRSNLLTNPKVVRMARLLLADQSFVDWFRPGDRAAESCDAVTKRDVPVVTRVVVGGLLPVWAAVNDSAARDGVLRHSSSLDVDEMAGVPGFGEAMAAVEWMRNLPDNAGVQFVNFEEHNSVQKERSLTAKSGAERQREYRERKAREDAEDRTRNASSDARVTSHSDGREEKRREEKNLLPSEGDGGAAPRAAPPTPPPAFDGANADALNGKAVVALASTFDLPEAWGFDAEALGFKPGEVNLEAERFRQYWTVGKGKGTRRSVKGWRQSWSNWLGKAGRDVR